MKKLKQIGINAKKAFTVLNSLDKRRINKVLEEWKRPSGLRIKRVTTPIGIIAVIYESRPNVTADVSALCLKSGNCGILRGGSEAYNSNKILANLFRESLKKIILIKIVFSLLKIKIEMS